MNHLIYELFNKARSENEKVSSNAITDLCCILEMNTWGLSKDKKITRYGGLVSQAVIEIEIDKDDEAEIVDFIHHEITNGNKFTSNLLFAMGQSSSKVALEPLIDVIVQYLDRFNENEFYQALISLERLLFFNESLSVDEEKVILTKTNLLSIISKKILSFQPISHSDLEGTSLRFFARTILLLNSDFSD